MTFDEIESFRQTPAAIEFAEAWLRECVGEEPDCDHLLNLTFWQRSHPHKALGIILNLVEQAGTNDALSDQVALCPVTEIIEMTDNEFTPYLKKAIDRYPEFALLTKRQRETSDDPRWVRLK
jgi:hypothetical protein